MTDAIETALAEFRRVVGEENVITDFETRQEYETATFQTDTKIPAIIRPGNVGEVQQCMQVANRFKVPVYPISTGLNVGYGSRVPTADGCVVLELKRMKRILEFNEDLAYVTLEPGVTQQQLYDYLKRNNSTLWMDVTGAFRGHSVIGNISERGFGHTPYGDHFANVGGMEVVLPNGELLHTGFGRFSNAKAAGIYRWGIGPYLDGLFTQSNLGIITGVTLWLMPAPEYFQNFFFSVEHQDQLAEIIDLLRPLRLNGTLRSAMHIGNDYKVLSSIQQFPWDKTDGKTPLPRTLITEFAKSWDFGAWNASGSLYGTRQEVASARKRLKRQLKGKVKRLRFLDDRLLRIAELIQKPYHYLTGINLPEMLKIVKPVFGMTKGVPTDAMIPSTYWRKKGGAPVHLDPDMDGCGLMWLAPVAPTEGKYAMEIWQIVETTLTKYNFEPAVSITLITERAMDCVISISYDRDVSGEDVRAQECHDELLNYLTQAGYYPYRLGIQSMGGLPISEAGYVGFIGSVKEAVDPQCVLAPGRYIENS